MRYRLNEVRIQTYKMPTLIIKLKLIFLIIGIFSVKITLTGIAAIATSQIALQPKQSRCQKRKHQALRYTYSRK